MNPYSYVMGNPILYNDPSGDLERGVNNLNLTKRTFQRLIDNNFAFRYGHGQPNVLTDLIDAGGSTSGYARMVTNRSPCYICAPRYPDNFFNGGIAVAAQEAE
jgi:hypothetical protein